MENKDDLYDGEDRGLLVLISSHQQYKSSNYWSRAWVKMTKVEVMLGMMAFLGMDTCALLQKPITL